MCWRSHCRRRRKMSSRLRKRGKKCCRLRSKCFIHENGRCRNCSGHSRLEASSGFRFFSLFAKGAEVGLRARWVCPSVLLRNVRTPTREDFVQQICIKRPGIYFGCKMTLRIEDVNGWNRPRLKGLECPEIVIERDVGFKRKLVQDFLDHCGSFVAYGVEDHWRARELFLQSVDGWKRRYTRATPTRPEVDDDDFAFEFIPRGAMVFCKSCEVHRGAHLAEQHRRFVSKALSK